MSVSVFSALSIVKGYDGRGGESSSTGFPSSVMMGMTWVRSDCVGEGGSLGEFEGVARTAYLCFVRIFRDYFVLLEYSGYRSLELERGCWFFWRIVPPRGF